MILFDLATHSSMNFQDPASPIAEAIGDLHHTIFTVILVIATLVIYLLGSLLKNFYYNWEYPTMITKDHKSTKARITFFFILILIVGGWFDAFTTVKENLPTIEDIPTTRDNTVANCAEEGRAEYQKAFFGKVDRSQATCTTYQYITDKDMPGGGYLTSGRIEPIPDRVVNRLNVSQTAHTFSGTKEQSIRAINSFVPVDEVVTGQNILQKGPNPGITGSEVYTRKVFWGVAALKKASVATGITPVRAACGVCLLAGGIIYCSGGQLPSGTAVQNALGLTPSKWNSDELTIYKKEEISEGW
jgi:heme/copper-type cytochrome/quinol oxidase subunit 2